MIEHCVAPSWRIFSSFYTHDLVHSAVAWLLGEPRTWVNIDYVCRGVFTVTEGVVQVNLRTIEADLAVLANIATDLFHQNLVDTLWHSKQQVGRSRVADCPIASHCVLERWHHCSGRQRVCQDQVWVSVDVCDIQGIRSLLQHNVVVDNEGW